uniref:Uncharacterized protein n=1 Tax=Panagrolaimus sp. PS1159 TaxID=55785 RepID=A0AC35GJL9_9BILA
MFRSAIFWSILLLSIAEVYPLRGGLIRNGRNFYENVGVNEGESVPPVFYSPPSNSDSQPFFVRPFQEFMRFGRSSSLPGAHQNFFRGRRDDSDEVESARFG